MRLWLLELGVDVFEAAVVVEEEDGGGVVVVVVVPEVRSNIASCIALLQISFATDFAMKALYCFSSMDISESL